MLSYVDYNKSAAIETLKRELDWKDYGDKHFESIWTRFYQGYILPTKFGFDKRRAHLSVLILTNQIRRDEACAELEKNHYVDSGQAEEDKGYAIKKFGLTNEKFDNKTTQLKCHNVSSQVHGNGTKRIKSNTMNTKTIIE